MADQYRQLERSSDAELSDLEERLGTLAGQYRSNEYDTQTVVREYHTTMLRMIALGWNRILDWDSELPRVMMPKEYYESHNDT